MAAWLGIAETAMLMAGSAGLTYYLGAHVGFVFSANADIAKRVESLVLYGAWFQLVYGIQTAVQGVLRATLHQRDVMM